MSFWDRVKNIATPYSDEDYDDYDEEEEGTEGFAEEPQPERPQRRRANFNFTEEPQTPGTSGTTGTSKGVMLSQKNLTTSAYDCCAIIDATADDTLVSVLPIHHAYEFTISQLAAPNIGISIFINDSIKKTLQNL